MCYTAAAEQLKKNELMQLWHEAQHDRKAHAMASRTKGNLKVFTDNEDKNAESGETQEEPIVDLKHLFTKHDRRVPHLPSEKIPDMLSVMKERQRQRRLEQEKAKKAADAAEAAKIMQQKLNDETTESDLRHKKLSASSVSVSDRKHSPPASHSVPPKAVSADRDVESKRKVKKKSQPPPMSFEQLMALAEQKQTEPVVDTQPVNVPKRVSAEQERPMTQEEKDRQKRRGTKEYQHWLKYGGSAPPAPSSGKSRHQQHAREPYKSQRTVSSTVSGNDMFDQSDSESDHTCSVQDGTGVGYKHSSATKTDSSQRLVEHRRPVSREEILFTKGKVMSSAKGNDAGQNGKCKSLSDDLIEKLKEERRKMVDNGDAVPSLADMLQDLLNKVRGEPNSQETTSKQSLPSGTWSLRPSSNSTKSKKSTSERKVEPFTSIMDGSRSQSTAASGTRPSSQYVTVNETVVDCARDKSNSTKPVKPGDKRPMKSTWEEMYERSKSKNPNRDDRGILHNPFVHCLCSVE